MEDKKVSGTAIFVGICIAMFLITLIILIIGINKTLSDSYPESYKDREMKAFQIQMNEDPKTWNATERKRFDDFMDWQSKQ
ncbi:MAG: hypothetical protein FWF46_05510 [Oscillospiraceae bacterium]|nr:hypothetical protein [Oscillospiraceae bacterium]